MTIAIMIVSFLCYQEACYSFAVYVALQCLLMSMCCMSQTENITNTVWVWQSVSGSSTAYIINLMLISDMIFVGLCLLMALKTGNIIFSITVVLYLSILFRVCTFVSLIMQQCAQLIVVLASLTVISPLIIAAHMYEIMVQTNAVTELLLGLWFILTAILPACVGFVTASIVSSLDVQ